MTKIKKINLFFPLLISVIVVSAIFSIFSVSFSFDISLLAFPISLCFSAVIFFFVFSLIKSLNIKYIPIIRKLLQYLPYVLLACFVLRRAGINGTPFWYDVVTVTLWCIVFVLSVILLNLFLHEKKVYNLKPEWKEIFDKEKASKKKRSASKWFIFEILDWIDALVQAIFMVLLIQIFIVQLYMIPSESMVPQFTIGDRVVVFKTSSGPKFPLSDVGIPSMKNYKRGDIVVFRNPHYSLDRKSEVKTVTSQLVYLLTFMAVNLNTDENGMPKPDPLVKRVVGVAGEQLVMQDGVLYSRTKDNDNFVPVTKDADFAAWNLNEVNDVTKRSIKDFPLSQTHYDLMLLCEKERREYDLEKAASSCKNIVNKFNNLVPNKHGSMELDKASLYEYNLFVNFDSLSQRLISANGASSWFNSFMTDWISSKDNNLITKDVYSEANYRLNVMIKECVGKLIVRNIELIKNGVSSEMRQVDSQIVELLQTAEMLNFYVMILDQRNMPVFPANNEDNTAQYIPDGCYFMMGDNRFNSADMRHSYNKTLVSLTPFDKYSVTYESNMKPQYVNKKYILGSTVFRFWPLSRIGKI